MKVWKRAYLVISLGLLVATGVLSSVVQPPKINKEQESQTLVKSLNVDDPESLGDYFSTLPSVLRTVTRADVKGEIIDGTPFIITKQGNIFLLNYGGIKLPFFTLEDAVSVTKMDLQSTSFKDEKEFLENLKDRNRVYYTQFQVDSKYIQVYISKTFNVDHFSKVVR